MLTLTSSHPAPCCHGKTKRSASLHIMSIMSITLTSLLLMLTGCSYFGVKHSQTAQNTHTICHELKRELLANEAMHMTHSTQNATLEQARIYQAYEKNQCEQRTSR